MKKTTEKVLQAVLQGDDTITPERIMQGLSALKGRDPRGVGTSALLLTQAEAARALRCSRFTIRRLEQRGRIRAVLLTPDLKRYRRTDVEAIAAGSPTCEGGVR